MKNKDPKISFYNSTAVYTVLKRYIFSDNEKQVIQAAILTAKKEKPNMQLINDADALLGTITTSQFPIDIPEDDMEIKKRKAAIKMAEHPHEETSFWKQKLDGQTLRLIFGVLFLVMFFVLKNILSADLPEQKEKVLANGAEGHLKKYTFEEAKALCTKSKKVLPLSIHDAPDFIAAPDNINAQGFWLGDGKIAYDISEGYREDDGNDHYVVCVDKTNFKTVID